MDFARAVKMLIAALVTVSSAVLANGDEFPQGVRNTLGPGFDSPPPYREVQRHRPTRRGAATLERLRYWNEIAIDASALDHTPVAPGENRNFGEQVGPGRTARAFAIVHIAIFDAVDAIDEKYESYSGISPAPDKTSMDAAIAQAAHDTLVSLYPSQQAAFDDLLTEDLRQIPGGDRKRKANGIELGRRAAAAILALRTGDGSEDAEPRIGQGYTMGDAPGEWRQDPVSQSPLAMGAYWFKVKPFVVESTQQFRCPPPPALNSPEYAAAFNEVKALGGDGVVTPTSRSADQTVAGIFWSYDGTPGLGTPPRLYNQIAVQIAEQRRSNVVQTARLLALVNIAMADAGTTIWESKYLYKTWRPVTGVREADVGTGPTGLGDDNPATTGDSTYTPLGAPASNLTGPNFTPPFPAYPSGHAGFGGAFFQILRHFYKTDHIAFTFVSDEFNGVTRDNQGNVRPHLPRHFSSLSEAEEENGQSRIYLGIHWAFDKTEGIAQGRNIADYVFKHALKPVRQHESD